MIERQNKSIVLIIYIFQRKILMLDYPLICRLICNIRASEYILFEMKSKDLYNIPGALRWGIDENDEEGNPVLVLIRLKDE